MEPQPLTTPVPKNNVPQNSKKRLFSSSANSSPPPPYMDSDDVVEIPPPPPPPFPRTPKSQKNKEVILHDVIEIDNDDDSVCAMIIDESIDRSVKGKALENSTADGYHVHQAKEALANNYFGPSGMEALGSGNGSEATSSFAPANLINLDGPGYDGSYGDDDYADLFLDESIDIDEYALLQAHFDNVDIPPGIEAPIPWLSVPSISKLNSVSGSSSVNMHPDAVGPQGNYSFLPQELPFWGSSSLKAEVDSIPHPPPLSSALKLPKDARSKKTQSTLQHQGSATNLSAGVESSKSQWLLGPFQRKKKLASSSNSMNYSSGNQFEASKQASGAEASPAPYFRGLIKKRASSTNYSPPGVPLPPPVSFTKLSAMPSNSTFYDPFNSIYPPGEVEAIPWVGTSQSENNGASGGISTAPMRKLSSMEIDEILVKFKSFKLFDTIEDHSDHHYTRSGYSTKQPPKNWAKRIQEEWKILEKDLPDTIFVRVYETRMDLLRAVIVGAEGTPYHDGLFFFDVCFPAGYPNVPPNVHYHSGGLRLNPNLYQCGKVCLSLLNTWSGNKNEKWLPGRSTMLQVLVSIQGLILNTKPYFNEPGYSHTQGSAAGEKRSLEYNENTFILSLKTMVYTMRRPPKHFEDLVLGHFVNRARDILVACKAYMDGAQVGCLVKGGVQDVDEGDKSCSETFKGSLAAHVPMLVTEFTRIGVKDCEKFLAPEIVGNKQISRMPQAAKSTVLC